MMMWAYKWLKFKCTARISIVYEYNSCSSIQKWQRGSIWSSSNYCIVLASFGSVCGIDCVYRDLTNPCVHFGKDIQSSHRDGEWKVQFEGHISRSTRWLIGSGFAWFFPFWYKYFSCQWFQLSDHFRILIGIVHCKAEHHMSLCDHACK